MSRGSVTFKDLKMKITRKLLREMIMEELAIDEAGGNPFQLSIATPERRQPRTGGEWGHSGSDPGTALSTDELFALFGAGFDPQEVANLNKSNIADHPRSEEILSILSSVGG